MKSIQKHLINLMIAGMGITLFAACGGSATKEEKTAESKEMKQYYEEEKQKEDAKVADDGKGIGKFTDVKVDPKLDKQMADAGKSIYDVKCSACHKLTDEKLVGPGWKGITGKRSAEWIMNFSTNPDEMLDKDAIAKGLLEECLVRMPNQGLSDDDARHIYEYMRENDGVK